MKLAPTLAFRVFEFHTFCTTTRFSAPLPMCTWGRVLVLKWRFGRQGVAYIILVHGFVRVLGDGVRINSDSNLFAGSVVTGAFGNIFPREELFSRLVSNMHMTK